MQKSETQQKKQSKNNIKHYSMIFNHGTKTNRLWLKSNTGCRNNSKKWTSSTKITRHGSSYIMGKQQTKPGATATALEVKAQPLDDKE